MKKKSFQEWSKEQALKKTNPFASLTNTATTNKTTKSPAPQVLGLGFNPLLNSSLKEAETYGRQNNVNLLEIANSLIGKGMYTPDRGDLNNWDDRTSRQGVINRAIAIKKLASTGMFDKPDYAFSDLYKGLTSTKYLKGLQAIINANLNTSKRKDEENNKLLEAWKNGGEKEWLDYQARSNSAKNRIAEYKNNNKDFSQPDESDILWLDHIVNGNDRWKINWGSQEYVNRYNNLVDQWLDTDWDNFELPEYTGMEDPTKYRSETKNLQAKADALSKEIGVREKISTLERYAKGLDNYNDLSIYKGAPLQKGINEDMMFSSGYFFINNAGADEDLFYDATHNTRTNMMVSPSQPTIEHLESQYIGRGYEYLTPDEVGVYNALYHTDPAMAQDYLDALQSTLYYRKQQTANAFWETLATEKHAAGFAWVLGRLMNITTPDELLRQIVATATGEADPNAPYHAEQNAVKAITQAHNDLLEDANGLMGIKLGDKNIAQHAYGIGTGATDTAVALGLDAIFGGGGKINQALMAANAMSQGLQESAEQNYDAGQSLLRGGIQGFLTYLTEKVGIGPGDMLGEGSGVLRGALNEAAEGLYENLGNTGADIIISEIFGEKNSYERDVEALRLQGEENPERKAIANKLGELITDAVYEGIGGGILSIPSSIANQNQTRKTGAEVKNQGAAEAILSIAEGMQDGSDAKEMARDIRELQKKNKRVTNYQLGEVTKRLETELNEENSNIVNAVMDEAIEDRLVELGDSKESAKRNAAAIRKMSRGQTLTIQERMMVDWTDNATQVVKELSRETAAQDSGQQGETDNNQNAAPIRGNDAEGQRAGQKWITTMRKTADGQTAEVSGKQMMMNAARSGLTVSESANEAVKNAAVKVRVSKGGRVSAKVTSTAVDYNDGGKTVKGDLVRFEKKDGKMQAVIQDGGGTREVDLNELTQYEGSGIAAITQYIQDNDGGDQLHEMTPQEANAMLNTYKEVGGDARTFIDAFEETYLAGYSGVEAPTFAVHPGIREIAYAEGQREAQLDEAARKKRAGEYRAVAAPKTGWLGQVTDNSQLTGAGDAEALTAAMEGMTESQRATAEAAMAIGNAAGLNVVLYESDLNRGNVANGKFSRSFNAIYIDINAGAATAEGVQEAKNKGTLGYAIIRTLGHELTHFLETASPEMYAKYKQAVRDELKVNRQDMAMLVREKLLSALNSGRKLTYAAAEAEVIADASEYMLEQSTFVEKMDPSLKDRVKNWVQGFMENIRTAFSHLVGGHKESAALRRVVDGVSKYTSKLQELWDASLMEAAQRGTEAADQSGEATEMVEDVTEVEQFQMREGTVNDREIVRALKWCAQLNARNDTSHDWNYVPVRGTTPQIVLDDLKADDAPMVMNVKKARQAMTKEGKQFASSIGHGYTPREMADLFKAIDQPEYFSHSVTRGNYGIVVEHNGSGVVFIIAPPQNMNADLLLSEHGGRRTVTVTMFDRDNVEDAIYYLENSGYKEMPLPAEAKGNIVPERTAKADNNIISEPRENVNTEDQYSLRDQTDTPEFKKWFGESKVVNEDGTPKVMYHGTNTDKNFTVFNTYGGKFGLFGIGSYFTDDKDVAESYTTKGRENNPRVYEVYLNIKNPLDMDAVYQPDKWEGDDTYLNRYFANAKTNEDAFRALKEYCMDEEMLKYEAEEFITEYILNMGFDGITHIGGGRYNKRDENRHRVYIAFEPTQIKSATDNVGTFDADNPDIRYSLRDEPDAVSIREYLGSMQITSRMTETEKILLKRYQENLKALEEKERQAAEQDAILRTATGDELIKAKNRYQIYRTQANRLNRALLAAERDEGFARLMATSQRVVNDYLLGSSGAVADAADALETEIADLSKRLKSLEAEVTRTSSGQRTAFARGLFDQKMLNAAAEGLKNSYGSRMSVKAIADRLALAYGELYAGEGAEGARNFSAAAKDLATDLLRGNKFRYKSEILPLLAEKIGSISLTETDRQEIRNAGISVTEYRRMLSPYIKVVENGSDLASYASSAQYYGEGTLAAILGDDVEGNLAMQLYNVISEEKAREADVSFEGMSEAELIGMAMADIAGANLPVNTAGTATTYLRNELMKYAGESAAVAQAIDEAVSRAEIATQRAGSVWREAARDAQTARQAVEYYRKLDETRRLMELQEQKQAITDELKSDNARKLTEKVQQYREEYRAREQKAREYRYARQDMEKLRRGIGRKVKRLNTLRMRETDQKHVPEELKRIADTVMQTFTDTSLSKLAFAPAKTASLARQYRALKEVESDASYYWDDEIEEQLDNLQALGEAYTALREQEGGMPSNVSLEGVQMESEILQGVDNIVSNVLQMIDSKNNAFLKRRTETFQQFANQAGNALLQHKDYKQLRGMLGQGQKILEETMRKGNMTPIYFFEHLRNPEMKDVFDEIRRGQSQYAQIVAEGKAYVQEMKNKYHYGAWVGDGVLKMKTGQGHSIELTREEAAEIYAIAERERRNALYQTEHLLEGGFQYKDVKNKGDGKTQIKNEPNKLNAADLEKIRNWLTEDQKAYADALVSFLSNQMAEYGNEASMAMYGYRKFTEKYYIPFHTVSEQRFQRGDEGPQGENAGTGRLKSSGFTKKLQHKANATLYIGGLTDTVADHIHKMASYAAMVEPIENMKRLLNHKVISNDGTTNTIRALIGQKYGQASQDYMTQLLKDLNGATQSDNRASGFTEKLIGAFKRGAVLASASVVLQQPTAAARAMAYISPKYFAQNPFYRPGKGTWDELTKYSGTAVIKDMGKFDVGLGMTARQYIADEHMAPWEAYRRLKAESKTEAGKAAYKRAVDWLTAAPGVADQWTWGLIWKAVKAEQAAMNPKMDHNSEEFLQLCGERFDDVIDHTQVYDSVLTRSNLMRSTNAFHKMATSFMSEPTLSLNMLYDALAGNHGKGKRAAIIGGVITSQVLAGALAALAQAWNDDEDKRNWAERYTDRAVSNVVDNLNPLGMIPYVSDMMSMFAGYEVERPDMSVIKDVIDYATTFFDKATDPEKPLTWKDYENFIGTLANLTGLPAKNISREMRRTWNMVVNSQWTIPNATNLQFVALESTGMYGGKNTEYYERIVNAYLRGDEERAEDYRTYMLTSKMVAEDKLQTGLKTAMKEAYIAGETDEDTAMDYLLKIGSYADEDEAYWEVDKWQYMRDTGNRADSYRKYADFFQAVETGTNLKATIQVYLDNGVSKTTLASQITNQYKQQLIDLKKAGKGYADLQARILTAYEALGYDRAKKLKDIQKWFK